MWHLPRLFARNIEHWWQSQAIDHKAATEIGEIELLAIMCAKIFLLTGAPSCQHVRKCHQQSLLIISGKRLQYHLFSGISLLKQTAANADDLTKLSIDRSPVVDRLRCLHGIVSQNYFGFFLP